LQIYYLEEDPLEAADAVALRDYHKAILYSCQLLGNVHHVYDSKITGLYKPNQLQHAYTAWVCESEGNYYWLLKFLIKALMNFEEYRHREHKSRQIAVNLNNCPSGMKKEFSPVTFKGLPYQYRDYPNSIMAHRAYHRDRLTKLANTGGRLEYFYKIPSWTGFVKTIKQSTEMRDVTKFSKAAKNRFDILETTIPVVACTTEEYLHRKEFEPVDIRDILDESE